MGGFPFGFGIGVSGVIEFRIGIIVVGVAEYDYGIPAMLGAGDGLHPAEKGYRLIGEKLKGYLGL